MKKILLGLAVLALLASASFAAVELQQSGTLLGKVETLNVTGATVTVTGKDAVVNAGLNPLDQYIDGSIYLTGANNGNAGVLWMSQSDGGCSRCQVDAAGTTFSCANLTCPDGM